MEAIARRPLEYEWPAAEAPWYAYQKLGKRVLDVVLTAVGLVLSLPLWLVIAAAIRVESRGPVFFLQERVGLGGRTFMMAKFRSMHVDAEEQLASLLHLNEVDGPVFKIREDPRVTRVGRWLRRSSLDELPQLINVLAGHMSLVGPRPPVPAEVAEYRPLDRVRLSVKPGITCLWQISGRCEVGFDRWMELDRAYIARLSLWLDLSILLRTARVVLTGRGAY